MYIVPPPLLLDEIYAPGHCCVFFLSFFRDSHFSQNESSQLACKDGQDAFAEVR